MNELERAQKKLRRLKDGLRDMAYHTEISERTLQNIAAGKGAQYSSVRKILDYIPPKRVRK